MEIQECKKCRHRFKVEALTDGLCALCLGQSSQAEANKGRTVSSKTIREDDVVRIVKETVPTRDQIEVMIRLIVKEELASMVENSKPKQSVDKKEDSIVGNLGPTSIVANVGLRTVSKTLKPKNCIKCGQTFAPRGGNQKKCDNCRKETN